MAASDQMVWQGELAVEQAIRQLQGQSVSDNVSPPILVMTPKNADREHIRRSLSPWGFRPVYFISTHQRLRNNLRHVVSPVNPH